MERKQAAIIADGKEKDYSANAEERHHSARPLPTSELKPALTRKIKKKAKVRSTHLFLLLSNQDTQPLCASLTNHRKLSIRLFVEQYGNIKEEAMRDVRSVSVHLVN